MPLANDFKDATQRRSGYAPLKLMWCDKCNLAQLSAVVDRNIIYKNYPYVTSQSETMKEHFRLLLDDLIKECEPGTVVEIGSNDGAFLKKCSEFGFKRTLGVDPADNLCDLAHKRGVETVNEFFNEKTAREIANDGIFPDLIVARHVFCHIDDWHEAIHSLGVLSSVNTVIAIEVPHFLETVKNVEWDQIYHEHLSFMTVKAMERALLHSMLHIHDIKHYSIHGGAIVILLRRNDCDVPPHITNIETLGLSDLMEFKNKAECLVADLRNTVTDLVSQGKTVVGYGATAKATQWIQMCGFTKKHLKRVYDNTPQKISKFMPGSDIPVVDPPAMSKDRPDYAVCFAWNWFSEIHKKEQAFKDNGGKWIVPVPEVKIV
jgi:novobiocin biosynthesis protein NovU/D-mycarose 3-C-methyltransferase